MNITRKNTKTLKITISCLAIITIVIGSYLAYAIYAKAWPFKANTDMSITSKDSNLDNNIDNQQNTDNDTPESTDMQNSESTQPPESTSDNPADKTPTKYTPPKGETIPKDTLTGVINYKNIVDGKLTLRTTIDQLVASGTCKLSLTHSKTGKTVTKTANIIANPSSSACNGFTIPVSELSSGKWNIAISLTSDNKQGTLKTTVDI